MRKSRAELAAAALLGLGNALSFHPRGGLTLTHYIVVIGLPVFLPVAWRLRTARWVFALLLVWMSSVALTSLITGDRLVNVGLALSYPVTIALSFCGAVWAFCQGSATAKTFVASLMLGLIAANLLYRAPSYHVDPWKYALGPVVTMCCVLVAAALLGRGLFALSALVTGAIALFNLLAGFRSLFLVTSVALLVTVVTGLGGRRSGRRRWSRCVWAGAVLSGLLVGLYSVYGQLAGDGALGREQQLKWVRQADSVGGAVVGARPEIAGSLALVADSPVIGRGVKPQVSAHDRSVFFEKWRTVNGGVEGPHEEHYYFGKGLLVHSILFQRWLETGILALPGLVFPIGLVGAAALASISDSRRPLTLVFGFLLSLLLWDLLFSPWSRLHGLYIGTSAAAAAVCLRNRTTK
ncbi:hypothetical protein [Streptomyces bullii]|uniref:O-antigen ligase n=1 Tax=Streptomyces bullii TaxID=349910 RepID=A0ABW0UJP8_9ACTN